MCLHHPLVLYPEVLAFQSPRYTKEYEWVNHTRYGKNVPMVRMVFFYHVVSLCCRTKEICLNALRGLKLANNLRRLQDEIENSQRIRRLVHVDNDFTFLKMHKMVLLVLELLLKLIRLIS